ncbi:hypothetical protein CE557_848 [Cardinium endosymbiont of Sogatella furcifera]|uniref:hypothetical protein n=1 Tax=Cardinium endosymbiont of Sogatella furcifera TaxID=650378 RepID=UPI000E0D4841|nr:hypothetical protein [Cardinium endosymbiont of Sogatella furcifera]AXI24632.1 hypothetical protein CE557_848 [Cardinium endosymbiont of Sogatella furcifera]
MFLLKLKVSNKLSWYIFSCFLLLLSACNSRIGYNAFDAISTDSERMRHNIAKYQTRYSNIVEPYWNNAILKGFLTVGNNQYDPNQNSNMENGLGYIFFNSLRARLNKSVDHTNLNIWNGAYQNFDCPKPWKYEVRTISGREYGVFYLDCVQMGEYFCGVDQIPTRNFDRIYNQNRPNGRAPYMKVCYADGNQERSRNFVLNIDHLLKDNSYLIELPKVLHDLKTDYLDPFITFRTETDRNVVSASTYWRSRKDYIDMRNDPQGIDQCLCLRPFQPPIAGIINEHIHDNNANNGYWKTNWSSDMMRDNVVRPRR